MNRLIFASLLALTSAASTISAAQTVAPAATAPAAGDLAAALETSDPVRLRAIAAGANRAEAALAQGALLALTRQDDEAVAALQGAARDTRLSPALRRSAWMSLSGVRMRQGHFADAVSAMDAGAAFGALEPGSAQARAFAAALTGVAPMRAPRLTAGSSPIERDMAQLARARVTINGVEENAVLDTGAAYSTITETQAARMRMRMLDGSVTVGSTATAQAPARLGVADTLTIGGATFRGVVFIVMPDGALSFAGGAYKIDLIVGFPVLVNLGRLEFVREGDREELRYGPSPHARNDDSNLLLEGLQPVAMVRAAGAERPLRLLLDTGARRSNLSRRAVDEFPALATGAVARETTVGGAGGTATHANALSFPRLSVDVAGAPFTLEDVRVLDDDGRRHGAIGQDLMRAGRGYVIDFDAMRFEVMPR